MKSLHRLLVTSATYRMASTPDTANASADRDNKYLWRYNSRPLEAEAVRDCAFFVAGRLDLTMGGPDIDYPLGQTVPRRSVYFRSAAEKQMEFLQIFDGPSVTECYERKSAIVPGQALALLNSELTLTNARALASAVPAAGGRETFVTAAFERVLSRTPTDAEMTECLRFLEEQTRANTNVDGSRSESERASRARANLIHVLLNHHEFVTLR